MDISETILSKEEQEDEDLIMIAGDEPLSSLDNISCSNLNKVWVNVSSTARTKKLGLVILGRIISLEALEI
jgi:hypothetical protein